MHLPDNSIIDYSIILCQLLECRKIAGNGTFMRLGIEKAGASHALGVVVPLACIDTNEGDVFYFERSMACMPRIVGFSRA
jgi:hypothetical protein